jgi:hypothetical protein
MNIETIEQKINALAELVKSAPVLHEIHWVSEKWAFEHFGSEAEAKFVAAASPDVVAAIFDRLARCEQALKHANITAF